MRPSIDAARTRGARRRDHRQRCAAVERQPRRRRAAAQAVEEGAELLADRNIIHVERGGRFRVRDRIVLRYYARTIEHLLARDARPHALMLDQAVRRRFFHSSPAASALKTARVALRHARPQQLRPPVHRRRDASRKRSTAARADRGRRACTVTLDHLGESVASIAEADAATRAYIGDASSGSRPPASSATSR